MVKSFIRVYLLSGIILLIISLTINDYGRFFMSIFIAQLFTYWGIFIKAMIDKNKLNPIFLALISISICLLAPILFLFVR